MLALNCFVQTCTWSTELEKHVFHCLHSCVCGCTCENSLLDARISETISPIKLHKVIVSQAVECVISVVVINSSTDDNKIKVRWQTILRVQLFWCKLRSSCTYVGDSALILCITSIIHRCSTCFRRLLKTRWLSPISLYIKSIVLRFCFGKWNACRLTCVAATNINYLLHVAWHVFVYFERKNKLYELHVLQENPTHTNHHLSNRPAVSSYRMMLQCTDLCYLDILWYTKRPPPVMMSWS